MHNCVNGFLWPKQQIRGYDCNHGFLYNRTQIYSPSFGRYFSGCANFSASLIPDIRLLTSSITLFTSGYSAGAIELKRPSPGSTPVVLSSSFMASRMAPFAAVRYV